MQPTFAIIFTILSACVSYILWGNDSYFMFRYLFGDFLLFAVDWFATLLYLSVVIVFLPFTIYFSFQCLRLLYMQKKVTPSIYCCDQQFYQRIERDAPILTRCYQPPIFWGNCGHLQTIIFTLLGRFKIPTIKGERVLLQADDGATISYDIFHPSSSVKQREDLIFFLAPGFASNSESDYVCTFMQYLTTSGYRCAVLNQVGTIPSIPVTAPRLFSFGHTNDLHIALTDYIARYPKSKVILFGFSFGGNLVPKYLGEEDRQRSPNILAAFSISSSLDAQKTFSAEHERWWRLPQFIYQYFLVRSAKVLISRHRHILLSDEIVKRYDLDVNAIFSCKSLFSLDELYTKRIFNFPTVSEYYRKSSAVHYLQNIKVPMIFINARDDPILSDALLSSYRAFAKSRKMVIAIELPYGGHLAFFENNYFIPESITWLERALIQLAEAIYKDCVECKEE